MKRRLAAALAGSCLALAAVTGVAAAPEQTLSVTTTDDAIELAVPVSRLRMAVPRGGLEVDDDPRVGASASPRYFHLLDRTRGLVLSGWFEPAGSYRGFATFWSHESAALARLPVPPPRDAAVFRQDRWEVAAYDLDIPHVRNTHLRAEWVEAGTWIDLHLSITTADSAEQARASALDVLKSIRVTVVP